MAICLAITPARAQDKYDSLGVAPQHAQPAQRPTRQAAAPGAEPDRRAFELATKLPISDADKNLRDELPADLPLVIQQLGLRMPRGTIVPVSPSPSASEFVDALKHP